MGKQSPPSTIAIKGKGIPFLVATQPSSLVPISFISTPSENLYLCLKVAILSKVLSRFLIRKAILVRGKVRAKVYAVKSKKRMEGQEDLQGYSFHRRN